MTRIAITVSNDRISPVFDVARSLLLVDDGQRVASAELKSAFPPERAGELAALGVDLLICGAISRFQEMALRGQGVEVLPWLAGDVDEVIEAYHSGRLNDARFAMPGCCGLGPAGLGRGGRGMGLGRRGRGGRGGGMGRGWHDRGGRGRGGF